MSSGNIVAGGKGDVDDNFVGWVVKVTADGCLDSLFCHTSSNHEPLMGGSLSLYPNPASDWITLEAPPKHDHGKLELYSLDGRLQIIQAGSINQPFIISGVPNGIYLCRFVSDNGKHFYSKLVVQK